MVDNLNPTSQFHPYQAPESTPVAERPLTGLKGMLDRFGVNTGALGNMNVNANVEKARDMARKNPGLVLGGLAALAIGAGLMRKRRTV